MSHPSRAVTAAEDQPEGVLTAEILKDCLVMGLLWIAVYVVLRPLQNTPFHDDWIYAWRVEWLLDHGQLRTLEYSSNPNFVQVLWGALFCLPFGFSFIALRVSTGVLAWLAMLGQYLLLRELRVTRRDAWIGTAVLALNPIFFLLAFTFMTEVPFLCLMIWACYAFVRAVQRESTPWLIGSIVLSCISIGVRVVGIGLPFASTCALLFHSGGWGRRRLRYLYPMITPLVLAGLIALMYGARIQRGGGNELPMHFLALWETFPPSAAYALACLGLWLLPLSAGLFRKTTLRLACVHFVWVTPLLALGLYQMQLNRKDGSWPLFGEAFWKISELGHITAGLEDHPPAAQWQGWLWPATILAAASISALLAGVWRRRGERREQFLMWLMGSQLFLIAFIWLIYDRYLVTLAPLGIALALSGKTIQRPALAGVFLGVLGVASLVGTRDHLAYNSALWQGIGELRKIAPDNQINAGYVANHWLQDTHPETAPRKPNGQIRAPWFDPDDAVFFRYEISTAPVPGTEVLKTIPYKRWLGPSGVFYLLRRN